MTQKMDLIGQTYGRLKVISEAETHITPKGRKIYMWNCVCECGNETVVSTTALRKGNTLSCGCYRYERIIKLRRKDMTGMKVGRLTVIEPTSRKPGTYWLCKCECGKETEVLQQHLKKGLIKSCGCYRSDRSVETNTKHGKSKTRIYKIWKGIIYRCYSNNTNNRSYYHYKNRGISVCQDWKSSFEKFYDWSVSNGYADNLTIDRIDVNGDYEPSNCRWVDYKVQANNKTNNVFLEYRGKKQTMKQWAEEAGIKYSVLQNRLHNLGWNIEKAIETPVTYYG